MVGLRFDRIVGIDRPISKLVLGTMIFNRQNEKTAFELLDAFVEMGGNCVDTAHIYGGGESERTIGRWLQARGSRDDVIILGKGAHPIAGGPPRVNPAAIERDLAESLERLQVETIDLYLLHRDDSALPVGPMVESLNEQKRRGGIRAFGGSNWTTARIAEANAYAATRGLDGFVASSPNLSLAKPNAPRWPGCVSLSFPDLDWHERLRFPVFSWSSQAGGFFTGRFSPADMSDREMVRVHYSEANWQRLQRAEELGKRHGLDANQIALAYVLNQPFPVFAIVGPHSVDELTSSARALDVELSQEELRWLDLRG